MSKFGERRVIGAVAGLGPAAVILGYYLVSGGPAQPGLIAIVAAAVAAGWLAGPRVGDSAHGDLLAVGAYVVAGYVLNSAMGVALTIWDGTGGAAGNRPSVLEAIGMQGVATIVYFPVWAIVLSPLGVLWLLTVRTLRRRFRSRPGAFAASSRSQQRPPKAGSLFWPPLAAAIAYLVGFMVVAPWTCSATQTVGGEGSATPDTVTLCSSLIGVTYSGLGVYNPSRELAIQAGLALAAVAFVVVLLAVLWLRRRGPVEPSR